MADLLAHMSVQHRGFAAAARGQVADWTPVRAADPVAEYLRAAGEVLEAFGAVAGVGATTGSAAVAGSAGVAAVVVNGMVLPEITSVPIPAERAIGFHVLDYVVHAWDLAEALNIQVTFDEDLLQATLAGARQVPGGEARTRPGAAFAPEQPVDGTGALAEILALLGRRPTWRARYDAGA